MSNYSLTQFFPEQLRPYTVGFDDAFRRFDDITRTTMKTLGYPPYNIVKVDDNKYVIEVDVAGFGKHDLEIELKESTLTITGSVKSDVQDSSKYLYKGIADRAFTRKFDLADTVEIKNAEMINGMLRVWLENIIPESKKPRKIDIDSKE